jgi:hypothetical protein
MFRSVARSWVTLLVVLALALGVTARAVLAADLAAGMAAMAGDGSTGGCEDCGDDMSGVAASICHLVCANPASLAGDMSRTQLAARAMQPLPSAEAAAGRSDRPDPSPPRPAYPA